MSSGLTASLDSTPIYNVKAAAQMTGLSPVTIRAWERRYGLPQPQRGAQGYRLYTELDIRTLRWLKAQIELGLSISRAARHLADLRAAGRDPVAVGAPPPADAPASLDNLSAQCSAALRAMDEQTAADTIRMAFTLYPIDHVLVDVIGPALEDIGERWHRGEVPVAVEHFATQFCLQHLMAMINATAPTRGGVIVAAGAPGEQHEIGLLMIVLMLRHRGWDVKYLGPNLSLERLDEAIGPMRPRVLLLTATRPESAETLRELPEILARFATPPVVVVGGPAFASWPDDSKMPGLYLDGLPSETVRSIELLMNG